MPNGSFVDDYLLDREAQVRGERSVEEAGNAQARVWRNWICCRSTPRQKAFFSTIPRVNRKGGVIDIHSFKHILHKYTHSLTGDTPGELQNGTDRWGAAWEHKRNTCQSQKLQTLWLHCYLPLFSPFLWAFLTEVAWGLVLVCECGGGEEGMFKCRGWAFKLLGGEKVLFCLVPTPTACSSVHKRLILWFRRSAGTTVATCQLKVYFFQQGED